MRILKYIFTLKFLYRTFYFKGMVQFEEGTKGERIPTICGDSVRWLKEISVKAFTYNKAETEALKIFNNKYPQYNGLVQID